MQEREFKRERKIDKKDKNIAKKKVRMIVKYNERKVVERESEKEI